MLQINMFNIRKLNTVTKVCDYMCLKCLLTAALLSEVSVQEGTHLHICACHYEACVTPKRLCGHIEMLYEANCVSI